MTKYKPLILLILFGLAAGIVLVEAALSFFLPLKMFYGLNVSTYGHEYELAENRRLIYVPVPNSYVSNPYSEVLNSYGHRGPAFPFAKGNKKRIVFMGDSVVEGLFVAANERFTDFLNARFGGEYEIVNLGVCGYSLEQEFEYFKLKGMKFSPDYVIWGITCNDLMLNAGEIDLFNEKMASGRKSGFYKNYFKAKTSLEKFLYSFNIYRLIIYLKVANSQKVFTNDEKDRDYNLGPAQVNDLLLQLKALSRKQNFKLEFLFLPVNTDLYRSEIQTLRETVEKNGIQCVDMRDAFPQAEAKSLFFDRLHFTREGHRRLAEALYEKRGLMGL